MIRTYSPDGITRVVRDEDGTIFEKGYFNQSSVYVTFLQISNKASYKFSGGPIDFLSLSLIGTKITLYPERAGRFHEPFWLIKVPP